MFDLQSHYYKENAENNIEFEEVEQNG